MEPSNMNTFSQLLHTLLGIGTEPKALTFLQISVRGVIVFIATLIMMRLSSKRSLAEKTAFDAVLVVIIGSMLARAINGSEAFFPTLGTGFVLVVLHRLFGIAAFYSHAFGILVKGKPVVLVLVARFQIKTDADDFGLMAYDPALMNTASTKSAITFIDGDKESSNTEATRSNNSQRDATSWKSHT